MVKEMDDHDHQLNSYGRSHCEVTEFHAFAIEIRRSKTFVARMPTGPKCPAQLATKAALAARLRCSRKSEPSVFVAAEIYRTNITSVEEDFVHSPDNCGTNRTEGDRGRKRKNGLDCESNTPIRKKFRVNLYHRRSARISKGSILAY